MKKNFITGFILGALIFGAIGAFAASFTAVENPFPIKLNGNDVNIEGYNINDNTYFKLRDIADAVGGFDVDFKDNTIILSTENAEPSEDDILTVATNAAFPPFEYQKEDGIAVNQKGEGLDGIDIAIAKRIAEETGKELQIKDMEFDGLIACVSQGKADMAIAGMTVTPERQIVVDFSEPYYNMTQVILTVADNEDILSANELGNNKKVGVILEYVGDYVVSDVARESDIVRVSTVEELVEKLENGEIDAAILDYEIGEKLAVDKGFKLIEDAETFDAERYAVAVSKGNTEMLEVVNQIISEMKASGELEELISSYIK